MRRGISWNWQLVTSVFYVMQFVVALSASRCSRMKNNAFNYVYW